VTFSISAPPYVANWLPSLSVDHAEGDPLGNGRLLSLQICEFGIERR
jgi:hypothetical protein